MTFQLRTIGHKKFLRKNIAALPASLAHSKGMRKVVLKLQN